MHGTRTVVPSPHRRVHVQQAASEALEAADDEVTLFEAAAGLSAVCAMELRAVLLAAKNAQQTRSIRSTLNDIRESAITMRTMGALLLPRLPAASVEKDLADGMLAQSGAVATLTHALEAALPPTPHAPSVCHGLLIMLLVDTADCVSAFADAACGARARPLSLEDGCRSTSACRC